MGRRGKVDGDDYVVNGRRGGKSGRNKRSNRYDGDSSDVDDDMSSFVSNTSYQTYAESVGEGSESGFEEIDALDQRFDSALEGAALKNTVVREKNLKIIQELLAGKVLGEVLLKRKLEVVDVIEKSIKHDNIEDRKEVSEILRKYLAFDNADVLAKSVAALSLILTICTPTERNNQIKLLIDPVRALLTHVNVDVRIEAGELLAHMFELGRDFNDAFDDEIEDLEQLIQDLEGLSTDAAKFRAKKDRKQQRSSFREILDIVNGEGYTPETVKVSQNETLTLESYSELVQYGALKQILGSATSVHLGASPFVRDIFGLGPPPLTVEKMSKVEKHEIKKMNAACHKARQRNISKHRDKRMIL